MKLKGIGASKGIAIAKAFILEEPEMIIEKKTINDSDVELDRFKSAISKSIEELKVIQKKAEETVGEEHAKVFEAHQFILMDPELIGQVEGKISNDLINAEYAFEEVTQGFIAIFGAMEDEYMRERAADIEDIAKRVKANLLGIEIPNPAMINDEVIIIARDLTPSQTAQLDRKFVKGFATDIGGRTSHSAIMARSLEIPAVVGIGEIVSQVTPGQDLIIDGQTGEVIINPATEIVEKFKVEQEKLARRKEELKQYIDKPTITKDGHQVELVANIGTPDDVAGIIDNGGEGVGLYRTEFLYMGKDQLPTEEEQFEAYKSVLEGMGANKPVVVRTLDIGGDKELSYLEMPHEMNPFLGYRAIRLCLDQDDIFRTQLRALLRASVYGKLKIMFPMISNLEEFRMAKALLEEEKQKLITSGHEISNKIEVGIMVEIPAAAALADLFAKEVDFFSIGTNDLIQYTMACDRMNEKISNLYQPYNPSVLRLVNQTIQASHQEGKWTGMCGEMAGELTAIPILLGLGLDEFSMSATSILEARELISKLDVSEMKKIAEQSLQCATAQEVEDLVNKEVFAKL